MSVSATKEQIENVFQGKTVLLPVNEEQAVLYVSLGLQWLKNFAPHRLKEDFRERVFEQNDSRFLSEDFSGDWQNLEEMPLRDDFPKYAVLGDRYDKRSPVFYLENKNQGKGSYWLERGAWGFQAVMTVNGPIVSNVSSQIQHLLNEKLTPVSKEFYCESLAR